MGTPTMVKLIAFVFNFADTTTPASTDLVGHLHELENIFLLGS
jgi:hypothetical protein